jgi:membrane-associated phospholipid phosphatase
MGLLDLRLDALADHKGDPNLYLTRAAFPSVHAAWPVVSLLVVMRYPVSVWARVATLAQLAIVWFAIVYAGEHYAIDVVAGTAFGAVAFVLVERFHGRLTAAALGRDAEPAPVTDEVVVVRQVLAPEQAPSAVGQAPGDGTTRG